MNEYPFHEYLKGFSGEVETYRRPAHFSGASAECWLLIATTEGIESSKKCFLQIFGIVNLCQKKLIFFLHLGENFFLQIFDV